MTPGILSLTFNDLNSMNRSKLEINTSSSETDPEQTLTTYTLRDKTC